MKTLFKIYEELYKAGVKVYSYNLCDTPAVTIEANKQYAIFFNPNAIHSLADETCIAAHEAGNLRLVLSVIQRFTNRGENLDDLFQVGCIGLIKAIDNFDISQDVRFSTYGVPMIIGEIRRTMPLPSAPLWKRAWTLWWQERLTAQNGKEPTVEEIAKSLDLRREDVVLALESIVEPVSLYEPVFSDGGDTIYVMDQVGDKNDDKNWLDEIALKEAMNDLSDREKRIMGMRFFQGKTQMEVAAEIGISQAQVSRLEKCALDKIKKDL